MTNSIQENRRQEIIKDAQIWFKNHKNNNCIQHFFDANGLQLDKVRKIYCLNTNEEARIWIQAYIGLIN